MVQIWTNRNSSELRNHSEQGDDTIAKNITSIYATAIVVGVTIPWIATMAPRPIERNFGFGRIRVAFSLRRYWVKIFIFYLYIVMSLVLMNNFTCGVLDKEFTEAWCDGFQRPIGMTPPHFYLQSYSTTCYCFKGAKGNCYFTLAFWINAAWMDSTCHYCIMSQD